MGLLTFRGGVHPEEGKAMSKSRAVISAVPGERLYFALAQHIGAPARPVVKKGDRVLRGQLLAEAAGFVSAPVHASVSGTVLGLEKRRLPSGSEGDCIVVENDGQMECVPFPEEVKEPETQLSREEILRRIREAGVVGMGGAGFPTHVKLSPKEPDKIDYILVNGAECEPYLTSDYRRMLEEPQRIVNGLKILLALFPGARGLICIEDNKMDCAGQLRELCAKEERAEVKVLRTKYPQGAERMLIYAATGRRINSSMLPADAGCIVDNIDTVAAVWQAAAQQRPLTERIMTVTGDAVREPGNFLVPVGMKYSEVLAQAGGFSEEPAKVISGGPMMGNALFGLEVPVVKTSSALLALTRDAVSQEAPSACINCGRCVSVCPGRVLPARLAEFADRGEEEKFLKYHGMECCECGCCSYVCPAGRHLTQSIRSMRKLLLEKKKR